MNSRKRRGLGQGLGALIPAGEATAPPSTSMAAEGGMVGLREVSVNSILPNPYQPRTRMEEELLDELAASIREHGIIQPLIVTQIEDGAVGERFHLIAGERRWRAAKRAGLLEVPVVVKETTERQLLELALIENIQRADLNPLEEATAYQQMAEFSNMTQNEIADRVGKSRSAVANTMRLLKLPDAIQDLIRAGELSEGHGRQLLKLSTAAEMMEAAQLFINQGFSVRQAEEWVKHPPTPSKTRKARGLSVQDRELQRQFTSAFGTRVELRRRKKGGQLVIYFENDEDLQSIYDSLAEGK
ncbi:MAG: ParB/RepB/Spo0J family partition protein [Chloroflexota bacterium]|nr:ParB/RepB/Spo0J family partition protein [Chloroflexota bacterium]